VQAKVIVVAGPSGSGKSRLCERLRQDLGLPTVNLDDFYKDGDDPSLPWVRIAPGQEIVDWDDPASWSADDALDALETLCRDGVVDVPVYDLSRDGRVGTTEVSLSRAGGGPAYVLAEGLFAQEVIGGCRDRGLLADAVCVRNPRILTFWRRLTRDLRERRKSPAVLVRRGWLLMLAEPKVVAHAAALGAVPMRPQQAYERITRLVREVPSSA
jgi:uridine kinase